MAKKFHIFVEGKADSTDSRFLKGLLNFLGERLSNDCIKSVGGWTELAGQTQTMQENLDKGISVLVIFDANSNHQKRREEIEEVLDAKIPNGRDLPVFLFPDDRSNGAVEDLLEQIIMPEHEGVFACFDGYKKCLNERKRNYTLPDAKAKIYAYKEAVGALQKGADPFDSKYWNYDHPALDPLKDFLTRHIGE